MIIKQITYGIACLFTGFAITAALPVSAIKPVEVAPVMKLSNECKQRTIQNNLVVICPDSESAPLRNMLQ